MRQDGSIERVKTIDLDFPLDSSTKFGLYPVSNGSVTDQGWDSAVYHDVTEAENVAREQSGLERLCTVVCRRGAGRGHHQGGSGGGCTAAHRGPSGV